MAATSAGTTTGTVKQNTILLIACLPRRPSLGSRLADELRILLQDLGHLVLWHDLYQEGFDPVLSPGELARGSSLDDLVQAHAQDLAGCDGLVIVHPDWWGQSPAILKGWVDRVFRQGVAYELEGPDDAEKEWRGLMDGKKALVFVSSDSADPRREALFRELWVDATLAPCGFHAECRMIGGLRTSEPRERREWLADGLVLAGTTFPAGS